MRNFFTLRRVSKDCGNLRHKMVLVDDDQIYGHLLKSAALSLGIELGVVTSVEELRKQLWGDIGALLIDYELQTITGARLISLIRGGMFGTVPPLFLISENRCIREVESLELSGRFIPKKVGAIELFSIVTSEINAGRIQGKGSFTD